MFRYDSFLASQSGAFVPPLAPQPDWANVKILLYGEGADGSTTFTDHSSIGRTLTANGNAQMDTDLSIYGTNILLDGTGDYVSAPNATDLQVGTSNDFCVEAFIRADAAKSQRIASKRAGGVSGFEFGVTAAGAIFLITYGASGVCGNAVSSDGLVSTGTIIHVAGTREGAAMRVFAGGLLSGSATQSGTVATNTNLFNIGRDPTDTARYFNGGLNWFRFIKGEALYTEDFPVPVPPLPTS